MEMELVQDYLNKKVFSLVKQVLLCEEERKEILLELTTFENTANNSRSGETFAEVGRVLRRVLENLVLTVNVENIDNGEKEDIQTVIRKCRYFNRGYCKYKEECKYYHSRHICEKYLENNICNNDRCTKRHPKHCRYWARSPEGCRYDACQYLHVKSKQYSQDNQYQPEGMSSEHNNCEDCEIMDDSAYHVRKRVVSFHGNSGEDWSQCEQWDLSLIHI